LDHRVIDSIVEDPFGMELFKKRDHVAADFAGWREYELLLQLVDDFANGELAGAEFEDDPASALDFDGALGKEDDRGFGGASPATTGGELGD
jgi:hypothetical protein